METLLTQAQIQENTLPGSFTGIGKLGLEGTLISDSPHIFTDVISTAIGVMTIVAGIIFIFNFFSGAIGIILAQGDKSKIEASQRKITTGIIGIGVVVAAVFVIDLVGGILGLDILNVAGFITGVNQ